MNDTLFHKEDWLGGTLEIHHDYDGPNPMTEWDHGIKINFKLRGYDLPTDLDSEMYEGDEDDVVAIAEYLEKRYPGAWTRVWAYQHGGMTVSMKPFGCQWDSGLLGFMWIDKTDPYWAGGSNIDEMSALEGFLEEYDAWLRGNCYGYIIKDKEGETLDSCWGFIETAHNVEQMNVLSEAHAYVEYEENTKGLKQFADKKLFMMKRWIHTETSTIVWANDEQEAYDIIENADGGMVYRVDTDYGDYTIEKFLREEAQ